MNMQDYKNAVDRIEISPDMRTEVLNMTTMTTEKTRRNKISMTRFAAAAASFILVAGIGGAVGYAMLNANKVPADSTPAANSGTPESTLPTVPDLSAFGLDAAAFSPKSIEPMNAFENTLWVYKGDVPQFSVYEYTDSCGNSLTLDKNGKIIGLSNLNGFTAPAEDSQALAQTYLQALVTDYDSYEVTENETYHTNGGDGSRVSIAKLYPNGMAAYATSDVSPDNFYVDGFDCAPVDCAYTKADYDAAFKLTLDGLNTAAVEMDSRDKMPEEKRFTGIKEAEDATDVDDTIFVRGDDGKIYGVYIACVSFEVNNEPRNYSAVPIIIAPEMIDININWEGITVKVPEDIPDENTAAVFDFEQSMPKLYAYFEWLENLAADPADDADISTTAAPYNTQFGTKLEEYTGLTAEQRTFRNDYATVTINSVLWGDFGTTGVVNISYMLIIDSQNLEDVPDDVLCTPNLTFRDSTGQTFEMKVDNPAHSYSVTQGLNNQIYLMEVDFSMENLPEHAEVQFTDFELTYTDRASQEQRSATLSGDDCTVELDKIPPWQEG